MTIHSNLETANDRFLSICLQGAIQDSWLSPADLAVEFPPTELMQALEQAPDLRTQLLIEAAGVHARIAPKKSTTAAAEDLQIALDEGVSTPELLLELFEMDDRVRHLDKQKLWDLLTRDEFWLRDDARARARMLATLEAGLQQELIDLPRLVRAVTPEQLAESLPQELLQKGLVQAIQSGLDGAAFDPPLLVETIPLAEWVEHVPLVHLWKTAVLGEIAATAGLASLAPEDEAASAPSEEKQAKAPSKGKKSGKKKSQDSGGRSKEEIKARNQAIANLTQIDRVPKNVEDLETPVLLAIDGMYAEMLSLSDDEQRAECIRDAFPNPHMLEKALYSLAETLDPRLDQEALKSREASVESLIQLVLFEERRRVSRARASSPPPAVSSSAPPPPPSGEGRPQPSVPPPLPPSAQKASAPPPPLPPNARAKN